MSQDYALYTAEDFAVWKILFERQKPLLDRVSASAYLQGGLSLQHSNNPEAVEMLGSLYWFSVEFGLILSDGETKIYGAGIFSSHGETKFSLSDVPAYLPFDMRTIIHTP